MSDVAIRVCELSKRYQLGQREPYKTLRETLSRAASAPFRHARSAIQRVNGHPAGDTTKFIWALRDVSFEVKKGEVVGIIGRNGSGKSTLLKILSRITEPTEGRAEIHGRVGSLLEVGTGFHPELTGRENIYLNGAVLGMRRAQIDRRFDEIVAFAEVDKFLDTPVKRYSSGMYLRLAFAVAAHLEPEILLIDEVLAVGDAAFQKKCLGRMADVTKEGRTVLFVSHNMPAMQRLCERVILLNEGKIVMAGSAERVVAAHLQSGLAIAPERVWHTIHEAPGDDVVRLRAVRVRNEDGTVLERVDIRRPIGIEVEYWNLCPVTRPTISLQFRDEQGTILFTSFDFNNPDWAKRSRLEEPGLVKAICWIPRNFLAEGRHFVQVSITHVSPVALDHVVERDAVSFETIDRCDGDGVRGSYTLKVQGVVRPMLEWDIRLSPMQADSDTND